MPCTFTPNPVHGPIGTVIAATGAGWAQPQVIAGVTIDGVAAANTLTVDGAGNLSGNITVPAQLGAIAAKDVTITGSVDGAQNFAAAFTIDATAAFVPTHGPIGQVIATTGDGWTAGETVAVGGVTVGGTVAVHTLTIDGAGLLTGNITCPAEVGGLVAKDIVITGSVLGAQTFAAAFTIDAAAAFAPIHGPIGQVIATTGDGWTAGETVAVGGVTVGGTVAVHTLTINGAGLLTGNITCPAEVGGLVAKDIVITGSVLGAQTFAAAFLIDPNAHFAPTSGPVGLAVTVTGEGWTAGETIAIGGVTVGGIAAVHTLVINGSGVLSGTLTIPSMIGGIKDIIITGSIMGPWSFHNAFFVTALVVAEMRNGFATVRNFVIQSNTVNHLMHNLGVVPAVVNIQARENNATNNLFVSGATISEIQITNADPVNNHQADLYALAL
jgi:hypothetical protein